MGAGSIMNEKSKSIFVDYKGKIFKVNLKHTEIYIATIKSNKQQQL
jgi:hypothetical protein